MGKVRLNQTNKINEGILGDLDFVGVTSNRGFSDRSIGDEFFRTGRNSGMDVIENPDSEMEDEYTDTDLEDMGYDYDGEVDDSDEDTAGFTQHSDLRTQLYKINQRLESIEVSLGDLFGSRGTVQRPIQ